MPRIEQALSPGQITLVRDLFREYSGALGVDLCFQDFDRELRELPGSYAPPAGRLLIAYGVLHAHELPAGCGALRPLNAEICEMKRLYVRPEFRRFGIGRELADSLVASAREIGYRAIRLDTLPAMREAHALYEQMGFRETAPYCHNPVPGVRYLELDLTHPDAAKNNASRLPR